jgi:hypothetical protein
VSSVKYFKERRGRQVFQREACQVFQYYSEAWAARMKPAGSVVDYRDRPPVGTLVEENFIDSSPYRERKKGVIIANDEDHGTEIGVRWDNGTSNYNLWCEKKGGKTLLYL